MIDKIKILTMAMFSSLILMAGILPAAKVAADCKSPASSQEALQCGACGGSGVSESTCPGESKKSTSTLNQIITDVINLMSVVGGIIAVIMLIVGGARYVTSAGNDQNVQAAKKTIMYAIIGLIVIATAQIVSKFVLHTVTK